MKWTNLDSLQLYDSLKSHTFCHFYLELLHSDFLKVLFQLTVKSPINGVLQVLQGPRNYTVHSCFTEKIILSREKPSVETGSGLHCFCS